MSMPVTDTGQSAAASTPLSPCMNLQGILPASPAGARLNPAGYR